MHLIIVSDPDLSPIYDKVLKSKIKVLKKPFQYKTEMAEIKEMPCSLIIPIKILCEFHSNFKLNDYY